nr:hypothetical protein CFP56_48082 [Quercus suber]
MVPRFYAAKKKVNSGTSVNRDSCRNSGSGRGKASEQSQGVTVSSEDSIEVENISSLMRNDVDGISREDMALKNKFNGEITEELKSPNDIETILEANNEELCLAKEFGAAILLGSEKKTTKIPRPHYNLSDNSQLKSHVIFMKLGFPIQKEPMQPLTGHAEKENSGKTLQKPLNLQGKKELQDRRQINLNCQQKGFRLLSGKKTHLQ